MTEANQSKKPAYRVYVVKGDGENARWVEIGAAWPHQDGKGFAIDLDALPLEGRIVLREPKRAAAGGGGQQ